MTQEYDYIVKMLMIGDSGVGKTSLLYRFADSNFTSTYISTIGVDFKIKFMDFDGKTAMIQVWDTAGQERFRSLTASYYRGSQGVIIVFDRTDYKTFSDVKKWLFEVDKYASPHAIRLLIGNKSDLTSHIEVSSSEASEFAETFGMEYMETSAKEAINVDRAFISMTTQIIKKFRTKSVATYGAKVVEPTSIRLTGERVVVSNYKCCV